MLRSGSFYPPLGLGILGGGQLGRMLLPPALRLGVSLHFLDREGAACQECSAHFHQGSLLDYDDVMRFATGVNLDALSIEIEHVNTQALFALEERGLRVCPSAAVLALVQDKLKQKQFYLRHSFPTAEFVGTPINSKEELSKGSEILGLPIIQKLRYAGYDGCGVKSLNSPADFGGAFTQSSLIEQKLSFDHEIAVLVVRDHAGKLAVYPPVEMSFHSQRHILDYLLYPAAINAQIQKQAQELASDLAATLQVVGVLAVEMFVQSDGKLLINEIAPRPHNSGHYTLDATSACQFEQHLRACLSMPLVKEIYMHNTYAATVNLLGDHQAEGKVHYVGLDQALAMAGVYVHLYGKQIVRPFRKMGHITILGQEQKKVQEKLDYLRKTVRVLSYTA